MKRSGIWKRQEMGAGGEGAETQPVRSCRLLRVLGSDLGLGSCCRGKRRAPYGIGEGGSRGQLKEMDVGMVAPLPLHSACPHLQDNGVR